MHPSPKELFVKSDGEDMEIYFGFGNLDFGLLKFPFSKNLIY